MVDNYVKEVQNKKIYITGVFQGGAIATICARHLAKNRNIIPELVTFGAPAQGLEKYALEIDSLLDTHYRVVNEHDFVPNLPSKKFVQSGWEVILKNPWWYKFFKSKNHSYYFYTKNLLKRFIKIEEQEELKKILKKVIKIKS
jgi:hypothetical protein